MSTYVPEPPPGLRDEIADLLSVARPTIVRDWRMARAWLQRELADA